MKKKYDRENHVTQDQVHWRNFNDQKSLINTKLEKLKEKMMVKEDT